MAGDRLLRILARLTSGSTTEPEPARLCEVCADVALMSGAGIMLMTGDTQQGSVCSSNEVSALIEELQFTLGEGPCVDAHRDDHDGRLHRLPDHQFGRVECGGRITRAR